MSARGITVVSASAGSGKTYRLTQVVSGAIDPAGAEHIGLESLVAVTYTRKAHAELTARIRRTLVSAGAFDEALRLPLAYLGTVHAACLRLLQEFAIDAGLSPNVDVASGDAGKLLRQSLEASLSREAYATLDRLAHRFQLRFQPITKRHEWLGPVSDIMDLARSNRIPATALPAMAERSVESLLKLLPKPESDGDALDDALMRELAIASKALAKANDGVGATKEAIALMAAVTRRHRDGEVDWCDWAKLARQGGSKTTDALLVKVREVASRYEAHPRLHAELRELTFAIYDAARVGLSAYQTWKERRRVVDYVDMLDRALDLVAHPRVASELRERLKLAVVDEFQDTSPIQLALFMKLHLLAKRSVWVGDRKQCIFEYAGADPMLMDSVASWVTESSGQRDVLNVNYRSRPELVEACSELFAAALARHEFSRDEVVVTAARTTPPELAALPPFGVWAIEAKNVDDHASSLASGVLRMLADASSTPVVDRTTNAVRAVRPGDIAVLVATNAEASLLADALHARGIRSAIARPGLLKTPEGVLVDAALRWLLDEGDTLAAAKIDALLGFGGEAPDAWLDGLLPRAVAGATLPAPPPLRVSAWRTSLGPVRARLGVLSPSEALDQVLASLDVVHLCARWPDAPQRVANLDALRGIASGYEDRCHQEREAGTVAGLLRYFDDMAAEKLRRDEVIASDDQHVPTDDGAVIVSTYHRAKGLEWPVVVLSSLDKAERRTAWEVCPESDGDREGASFDPEHPLAGRWIRYWPKPLGGLKKAPLLEAAEQSPEGVRVGKREEKERARLLYVGFTRARDHLVLAVRVATSTTKATKKTEAVVVTKAVCQWLDALADEDGEALLALPVGAGDGAQDAVVRVRTGKGSASHEVAARVWRLNAAAPVAAAGAAEGVEQRRWFARAVAASSVEAPRYRINPSNAAVDWPELALPTIGEIVTLPGAMAIDAKVAEYNVLGDAVHAFFAADVEGLTADARVERARRLLAAAGLVGVVRAEALVEASDRLRAFVEERWPGAIWHREVAIDALVPTSGGERRVAGIIDLLLETPQGYVIFDHKTFPAKSEAAWRAKVVEFLPQFAAYRVALPKPGGRDVVGGWVHLPAGAAMVEIGADRGTAGLT
jgi:ATP-dependent helicase/nuclease subunit A